MKTTDTHAEPTAETLIEPGPRPRWWEEDPRAAARADRMYWNRDEDQ